MIPSLIQCNSYILIYQFQLLKINWGRSLHDFLISTQCHGYIIIGQFQLSKFKKENLQIK